MRKEQEEQLRQGEDKRKRPVDRSSQSSGSGEEEEEGRREKGRKENSPNNSLQDYPGVRMFPVGRQEGGEVEGAPGLGGQGGSSRIGAPRGLKTTAPPFRSSMLLLPMVSAPEASLRATSPGSQ